MKHIAFKDLPLFATFILNGNYYVKRSTRTGYMYRTCKTFYIGANETVELKELPPTK